MPRMGEADLEIYRIATYKRVSTDRQARERTIESQEDDIVQYIKKNYPHVKIDDVIAYTDNGWTGTTLERPGIDEIFLSLDRDEWDILVVDDPDRIAREPSLQLSFIEEVERHGKSVVFCSIGSPDKDNPEERMLFKMRGLLSEYEKVRINTRFRIGKLRKARAKHILLSVAPYGYKLVKRFTDPVTGVITQGYLIIDEEEAKVIKQVFQWYVEERLTFCKIAKRLKELGIKPRKNKKGDWNTGTIGNIIRNTTYIGEAWYRRSEAIEPKNPLKPIVGPKKNRKTSRKWRPEEDWIKIPVPAILVSDKERDWFERATELRVLNVSYHKRNKKNEYLLSGMVRCSCGAARCGEGPQNGKYLYYRCSGRHNTRTTAAPECNETGVNARIADAAVWSVLENIISDIEVLKAQLMLYYSHKTNGSNYSRRITSLKATTAKYQEKRKELKKEYVSDKITLREYKELTSELDDLAIKTEQELYELQKKQDRIEKNLVTEDEIDDVFSYVNNRIKALNFSQKRAIVEQLIDEVEAVPGHLTVTGYVGVSPSSEIQEIQGANYSSNSNIYVKSIGRNCRSPKCGEEHFI